MQIYGVDTEGIGGVLIRFSAVVEANTKGISILGLAQRVVAEGCERAVKAIGQLDGNWDLSNFRITIHLSPAETPKHSAGLDLPIAITLLVGSLLQDEDKIEACISEFRHEAEKESGKKGSNDSRSLLLKKIDELSDQKDKIARYRKRIKENTNKYCLIGTLDIATGDIEPPRYGMFGMLSSIGKDYTVIVPEQSDIHAGLVSKVKGFTAYKAANLNEVWSILLGEAQPRTVDYVKSKVIRKEIANYVPDLQAINGAARAKEAMSIAVAGGHNILLVGPSGQGKSMLSSAATKLLPDITSGEIFEINKIYSAKGQLLENEIITSRPYIEVSQATTEAALFGGGVPPVPGEISLAHRGVLLFDEVNLFKKDIIERLRTPLEERKSIIQRVAGRIEYPCSFIMIATMNPCKCGWFNHFQCPQCGTILINKEECDKCRTKLAHKCKCNKTELKSYKDKLSNPMKDRMDLKVLLSSHDNRNQNKFDFSTKTVQKQIAAAREIQNERYKNENNIFCNADIRDNHQYEKFDHIDTDIKVYLNNISNKLDITPRQKMRLQLISRTVADFLQSEKVRQEDVRKAIFLMGLDNEYFRQF
ncbi:MAG: magnesium chelatase family protein [Candidatus Electronema aureum]|uniref:Magnesium chelatase family protein n=1 Tax=Candidatus Electronema aureum TaxID=2005002 RepID=A0A521G2M9_9BACT|nr:MAG: magnesium chelatase family protein [Candidatus Electronema aureum]